MENISLLTDVDLWQELCKRHDGVLLVILENLNIEKEAIVVSYHGGKCLCTGLAQHAIHKISKEMDDEEEKGRNDING